MTRLFLAMLLTVPLVACQKPDLPTLLMWARQGLQAACSFNADGQNGQSEVCQAGLPALDTADQIARKNPDGAAAAVKPFLLAEEAAHTGLREFTGWLTSRL